MKAAVSQQPELQWAEAFKTIEPFEGSDYSNGRSVAVDQQGNVYSAGLFEYTHDFDPVPGVFALLLPGDLQNTHDYFEHL